MSLETQDLTKYTNERKKEKWQKSEHKSECFKLTEPQIFRKQYECATWYKDIEVPPGTYPIYADVDESGVVLEFPNGCMPFAELHGKVIADDFSLYFAGWPVESKRNQYVGQEDSYLWSMYAHFLALALLENFFNGPILVELLPDFVADIEDYVFNGLTKQRAVIKRKVAGE